MDFSLTQSQELLQKSARDFLEKECKDNAREMEETVEGYSKKIWGKMAELGWMGLGIPSQYGGMDGDILELVILIKEMGRVLLPGPFIPSAVCSAVSILDHGTEEQKKELLPEIINGKTVVLPAVSPPTAIGGTPEVGDRMEKENGNFILSGTRLFVPYAHMADYFIFRAASTDDNDTMFLVDARSEGVACTVLNDIGSDKHCEVVLNNVKVPEKNILGGAGSGAAVMKRIDSLGAISHSAYLLGMLEEVLEMTVEYSKGRVQFGRPIGSFQAIQHQFADMAIDVDQTRNLTYMAAWSMSQGMQADRETAMAKARASDASRRVCLLGVKIHGGAGIIDEYNMQLYFRRAKTHELAYGDARQHRETVAREIGLEF
jgi:alkylation response protein AidB-like acyl-CoA dehydrogenase